MDDSRLHDCFRKYGIDRIWKALKTIDHRDQNIGHAPVFKLVHDPQPVLGTLGLFNPYSQNIFRTIAQNPERDVNWLITDKAFIAVSFLDHAPHDLRASMTRIASKSADAADGPADHWPVKPVESRYQTVDPAIR